MRYFADRKRLLICVIFIECNCLQRCNALKGYDRPRPSATAGSGGATGGGARIMAGLAAKAALSTTVMIDLTYLAAHCTAISLRSKKGARRPVGHLIGRTKGRMNTQPRIVADDDPKPNHCG